MAVPTLTTVRGSEGNTLNTPGNWPTTSNNDIMLIWLTLSNTTSPVLPSAPSGWTEILASTSVGSTNANTMISSIYWKRVGAAEGAPTFSGITGQRFFLASQIAGCVTSGNPFDSNYSYSYNTSNSTSYSLDIGTTTQTDCLIIYYLASSIGTSNTFSAESNSNLSSLTENYDTAAGESTMGHISGGLAAGGAVGTLTGTQGNALGIYFGIPMLSTTSAPVGGATSFGRSSLLGVGK